MLRRFWFEFDVPADELPPGVRIGCGVTAQSLENAEAMLEQRVFKGRLLPARRTVVRDIDIRSLDPAHVHPNMGNPAALGVWFPLGY